ncbi:hypothetical protein Syun_025833 [Stephania yunnanensis]|uniref:Uncharacterized protein n=1 Tax=Stephania yunnanensis TaxID=152371 RepID=A0AAP0HRM8_9MAGN
MGRAFHEPQHHSTSSPPIGSLHVASLHHHVTNHFFSSFNSASTFSGFVPMRSPRISAEFARFSPSPFYTPLVVHSPHNNTSSTVLSANPTMPPQRTAAYEPIWRGHMDKTRFQAQKQPYDAPRCTSHLPNP